MKKRIAIICLGMGAMLLLAACENRELPQEETPASSSAPAAETALPEEERFPDVTGLELYENGRAVNENGDVFLTAALDGQARMGDQYLTSITLYDLGEERMLVTYMLSDTVEYESAEFETWLASYNMVTGKVEGTVQLPPDHYEGDSYVYNYQEQAGSLLWNRQINDDVLTATAYDSQLRQVMEFTPAEGTDSYGYFSRDGEKYYACEDGVIVRYPTGEEGGTAERLILQQNFSVSYLSSLFTDDQGTEYAQLYGMAGDLYSYDGIVNLDTGELVYLSREGDLYLTASQGVLMAQAQDEEVSSYTVFLGSQPHTYSWNGTEYVSCQILSSGDLLFYYSREEEGDTTLCLGLYDGENGTLISSTSFRSGSSYAWLSNTAVSRTAENKLILCVTDEAGATQFFTWEFGGANHEMDQMAVTEAQVPEQLKPEIVDEWDPTSLKPGDCPEELADLRRRADQMEEEYGVRIYISEECTNYLGGYVVMPESDYSTVEEALNVLEAQLGQYPEGFFEQFRGDWIEGIDIYLAGTLMGRAEDVLDYAGGFQLEEGGHLAVVLDSTYPYSITSNFHHEISHAIEYKIGFLLDEAEWAALNPEPEVYGDCYTYSYAQFGREDLTQFIYTMDQAADAYFIDDYSMTYPTEDRARLFENVMNADYGWIDWEAAPHLRAKLNQYAACIRAAFDTTGWENVPWEAYLD